MRARNVLIAEAILAAIIYLVVAFSMASLDITTWPDEVRAAASIMFLFFGIMLAALVDSQS